MLFTFKKREETGCELFEGSESENVITHTSEALVRQPSVWC